MKTIGGTIDLLIENMTKNRIDEKEKQKTTTRSLNIFSNQLPGGVSDEDFNHTPELDEIIEKLNIIRAGRSLKDKEIHSEFETYYNNLDEAEKIALYVYLKGLGEIVTAGEQGTNATEPGDKNVPVSIEKDEPKIKSLKPNVIKTPVAPPDAKKSTSHEEDTSPPLPIKVKKK